MAKKKYISLSNLTSFLNNLKNIFATKTEVNTKSDKSHTHTISDISNLQSTLDGKAAESHGTHVTYSTTAPVVDGTASVGTASTVARSDHRHPIDTSRAAQTSLDSHTSNTTTHITSAERTNWNTAYTHSQSAHAPSNAEANQNAFSNVKVGDVTIAADIKTDTLTLVAGNNITLTPDATNDKITISAKDTTYTLGSFGITATATELNKLDGVTVTATEINYIDGVTSNIQTQIDNKVPTSCTINGKALSSNITLSASDVGADASGTAQTKADNALSSAKNYTDTKISALINSAPTTLDTLGEIATAMEENVDVVTVLEDAIGTKANASDLTSHTNNKSNPHSVTKTQIGLGNVENKSSATIRSELTKANVTTALGYTPPTTNTTYGVATSSALGLIKSGTDITVDSNGNVSINDDSHNHTIANIDNLQSSLDAKQSAITGGASTITSSNLTANRALISNGSGKVAVSAVTSTELGYLDGVTSNVQTQLDNKSVNGHTHSISNVSGLQGALDGKSSTAHTHSYAGSPSVGGGANTLAITDTRNVNDTPTEMTNLIGGKGARLDFKSTSTVGLSNGNYAAVLSISPWGDTTNWSGGKNTQLGFCDDGRIQVRKGNNGGWTDWNTIIDSSIIGNQSVKYATSAGSATSATKATQDASGNTITSTYATKTELDTAKSTLQTSINGKANSSHTHTIANITNLQTTLDGKSNTSHTHKYASSASVGGSATSAVKLDTSTAGDANTPVYFTGGKPVACTSLDLNTSGSSASCTGNSATATKLQTARTIGLGTGATGTATSFNGTGNITIPVTDVKESYLSWGGKSISGGVSPIDAACSNIHSANRFAFAKAAGITIEYSTNGSTYSAYSTTDAAKVNLVSGNGNTYYIGARSSSTTVNDKLRITLNATNMGLYTRLRKLLINISTSYATGCNVIIEKAMKGSETTFTTIGTYQISGWSGWNSIPINAAFGGGSNQTGNIAVLRLTFGITGVNSEQTSNALSISDIIGIGDTYWSYPSTMAKTGHIYTYDSSQNTTFPANVTATTFVGALSGNATTATTASKLGSSNVGSATQPIYLNGGTPTACTYTLGKSVPSNAVFTDTNTKVTNTLATTTKAYVTGTTSASTNTGTQVFDTGVYLDTTAGQLTATTFNGTTFSGSGVATVSEVKTYLGI